MTGMYDANGHIEYELSETGHIYDYVGNCAGSITASGKVYTRCDQLAGTIDDSMKVYAPDGRYLGTVSKEGTLYDNTGKRCSWDNLLGGQYEPVQKYGDDTGDDYVTPSPFRELMTTVLIYGLCIGLSLLMIGVLLMICS